MGQLRVIACTSQRGRSRYPSKEDGAVPEVARYRNNLIAMSQCENLFFVAYLDKIHVFRPEFPLQGLPKVPELIVDLPESRTGRGGHLDLSRPHAVNHLMVGDLGNEEILVAACDDGDVISYTMHSIIRSIERVRANDAQSHRVPPVVDGQCLWEYPAAKPWFLENVGQSAWGLAIHKEARFLAVSSNTQLIDIFAPALINPSILKSDTTWDEYSRHSTDYCVGDDMWKILAFYAPSHRMDNLRIRLYGHTTNIPNITFANVDHQGRYLASTDIEGHTFIWDIYSGSAIFRFQSSTLPTMRGWGVVCLDLLTSRLTNTANQTFGCDGHTDETNIVIDISDGCHSIPNNSQWHPGFAQYGAVPGTFPIDALSMLSEPQVAGLESEELSSSGDEEMSGQEPEFDDQVGSEAEFEALNADADQEGALSPESPLEYIAGESGDLSALETPTDLQGNNDDPLMTTEEDHGLVPASPPARERKAGTRLLMDNVPTYKRVQLPFDLLQTSVSDICLFCDIHYNKSTGEPAHSRVISQQALHQKLPPGLHQLSHIERLNMIAQIPELGVVIIGNQAGRVGILTATRWEGPQQSGFRVEYILPFRSQEEEGLRPEKALMGMAVSPLQGHANLPNPASVQSTSPEGEATRRPISWGSSRRFRLLLVYCDHTMLSYEISRPLEDEILML